jgi:hypothetical protein
MNNQAIIVISCLFYDLIQVNKLSLLQNMQKDFKKLRNIGIFTVVTLFLSITGTSISAFIFTVTPYGWPQKSFMLYTPPNKQSQVYAMVGIVFFLPVIVSCIMSGFLFCNVKTKINKVGPVGVVEDSPELEFGGIYIGQALKSDQNKTNR